MTAPLCMSCGKPFVAKVANSSAARNQPKRYVKCIDCRLPSKRDPMTEADEGHSYRQRLHDGFALLEQDDPGSR